MKFKPIHINATEKDFLGNGNIGRYIFFPGSDGRAKAIAEHFSNLKVKEHPRGHNLYFGTLEDEGCKIDVAAVSSGMGTPSVDIILNELLKLGAKRFLRVGSSGSLQPNRIKVSDFVVATGAVRDEGASRCYLPLEFPAIASFDIVHAAVLAAKKLHMESKVHADLLHSKDSFYAREFGEGPLADENKAYVKTLGEAGVSASEMEASMLFTLASLYDHRLKSKGRGSNFRVLAGAICVILSAGTTWATKEETENMMKELTQLSIHTLFELNKHENNLLF